MWEEPGYRLRLILKWVRSRAKRKGIPFDLRFEDVLRMVDDQGGCCARSGLPFVYAGGESATSPSVDRIDPAGGYTRDNVQIVLNMYNMAKSTVTDEKVLEMAIGICKKAGYTVTR